jgi:hypothetical protein
VEDSAILPAGKAFFSVMIGFILWRSAQGLVVGQFEISASDFL